MSDLGTLWLERDAPSMTGPDVTPQTFSVLLAVARERQRQDARWGPQSHPPEWWLAILIEEVGEAAQEVLGLRYGEVAKAHGDLRKELLHAAAVAVSAIEALDYGAAGLGRPAPAVPSSPPCPSRGHSPPTSTGERGESAPRPCPHMAAEPPTDPGDPS